MKRKLAVFGLVLALFAGGITEERARANTSFGFNLFYSDLAPYGNWMQYQDYGYAWSPGQVAPGWQPYVDGQWVWSDQGWTWASYEPWGWATYHYGRWVFDPYYGWLWLPGTTWAPAWVSWYQSPGYVGWSPLPPDNNFFLEIGLSFVNFGGGYYDYGYNDYGYYGYDYYDYGHGYKHKNKHRHHKKGKYYDNDYYAPGEHCVFVPEDKFGRENAKIVAVKGDEKNLVALRNAKNVTNIKVDNDRVYNYGPDKGRIERAADSKIKQVSLADSDLTTLRNGRQNQKLNDDVYRVYRPKIEKKEGENPFTAKQLDRDAVKSPSMSRSNLNGSDDSRGRDMRPQGLTPKAGQRDTMVQDRGKPIDQRDLYGNRGPEEYGVIRNNNGMQRRNVNDNSNDERPFTNGRGRQPGNGDLKAVEREPGAARRGPVEAMNVNPGQASRQQRNPYYPGAVNNSINQGVDRSRGNRTVQMPRAPQERQSMNRPPDSYKPRNSVRMPEMRQAPSPARGNMNAVSRPQPDRSREQRVRSVNNYNQPQYKPERSARNNNSRGENRSRNTSYGNNRDSSPRPQSIRSDSPSMRSSNPGSVRSFNGSSSLRSRSR